MGREEQKEEREVLDSIFPDEITDISETEYRVSIALETGDEDGNDEEDDEDDGGRKPTLILRVQYPEAYPDVAPDLDIWAPPNAKYADIDVQEDKARLLQALQPEIEDNMGMAMVFTLVSTLKDSAEQLISERRQVAQSEREKEAAKAEEEENRKFQGSAVTRDTFLEWRDSFRKEMQEMERRKQEEKEAEEKKKRLPKEEKKLTGRQIWERGLAGKVDEEEGDGEVIDIQKLKLEDSA